MRAVVTETFIDKTTKEQKLAGTVIEISESRFEELEGKGFVKAVVAMEKPVATVKAPRKAKKERKDAE